MPTGGSRTSLAGMVSAMTNALRRRPQSGATAARGAPIASYSWGNNGNPTLGTNVDITQFAPVFQPSGGMFSPGYPLVPVDRERLRAYDFTVGTNYIYTPRSPEPTGFAELRALAQNHDITRLCIETRKDQIEALEWLIKPRDEKNPKAGADERADKLTEFWRRPDGINDFATWLRLALEDVLVLDAPAFELRRNRGGDLIALEVIDGATIKVLIDDTGRRPLPPAPAYEQIIHGRPWVLTEDGKVSTDARGTPLFDQQIIYLPRNPRPHKAYGFSPVEQVLMTVNIGLRRQVMQLQHFTEGNVPAGMATAPAGWSAVQVREYQEWFDSYLAGNTAQRTRVVWGPDGAKYQPFKEAPYKDDFDEWLARIVCFAFSLPPTWAVRQVNRATAGTAQEVALEEGLAPIMGWVKRLVDSVIQNRQGHPDLEFSWRDKKEVDQSEQSKILTDYVKDAIYTINEARDILGLDPIEGGDLPLFVTAQGPVLLKNVEALGELALNPPAPPPMPGGNGGAGAPGGKPAPQGAGKPGAPGKSGQKPENGKKPKTAKLGKAAELDQDQAGYVDHPVGGEQCSGCTMFLAPDACDLVDGEIAPAGHCDYFEAEVAKRRGASPFGGTARLHSRAHASIRRRVAAFLAAEAPKVARELLAVRTKTAATDPKKPKPPVDEEPDEDDEDDQQPSERHTSALVALALASIGFDRWTVLTAELRPEIQAIVDSTIADAAEELELTAEKRAALADWGAKWAAARAKELVGLLTAATPKMIEGAVATAIKDDLSVAELRNSLGETAAFSDTRADRVADFETVNAYHATTLAAFHAGGVKTYQWVTMGDDLVEQDCQDNEDEGPIALGETFPSGDDRPPAHLNCRCWLEPGDEGDEEA